jgi:drug/metabolite transporter (DMT)-like permease
MKDKSSATTTSSIALPGAALAFLGVLGFSFTFPATVLALDGFGPFLITFGRAAIAAVLAAAALLAVRAARPNRRQLVSLAVVGGGVVLGFPGLTTLALHLGATASHSAVVIGVLPAATAVFAVLRAGERPAPAFWAAGLGGTAVIVLFALSRGAGHLTTADALLLCALFAGGLGYAEGGRLAREMPAWRVISWALVLCVPVSVPASLLLARGGGGDGVAPDVGLAAVLGLAYVGVISMLLGFFAWYAGMARAGVARAGQVQLAQPILTLVWSWIVLDERLGIATPVAAVAVLCSVAATQRARVRRVDDVSADSAAAEFDGSWVGGRASGGGRG